MPAAADDMKAAKTTVMVKVKRMVREDVILGCTQINLGKNVCILFFIYKYIGYSTGIPAGQKIYTIPILTGDIAAYPRCHK
jgi:hypothetical protein